jgi:hypothetical protein
VQAVQRVPPVFFLEVKRKRTSPFWVHEALKPLDDGVAQDHFPQDQNSGGDDSVDSDHSDNSGPGDDDDDDDDAATEMVDTQPGGGSNGLTFEEAMAEHISIIKDFTKGLTYQIQFRDDRMLQALQREGASFFRLARACLTKEKRMKSTRGKLPTTWEKSTNKAMFYNIRPAGSD